MCKVLYHLFARLLIEKKRPFFLANEFAVSTPLLRHNRYYDIIKFQIDLVILASSKNFDNRLHNFAMLFFFSRDFVLATSGLFVFSIYIYCIRRRDFFRESSRKVRSGERD